MKHLLLLIMLLSNPIIATFPKTITHKELQKIQHNKKLHTYRKQIQERQRRLDEHQEEADTVNKCIDLAKVFGTIVLTVASIILAIIH